MSDAIPVPAHNLNSPFSAVFLGHIAVEIPLAIQAIIGVGLPFIEMTNTTLVILKLYGAIILGTCVAALACFGLPDIQPGKRALAIAFIIYHSVASTILIQSPRFIPMSFGNMAESWRFTPEVAWGSLHGILSLLFVSWWQVSLPSPAMLKKLQ